MTVFTPTAGIPTPDLTGVPNIPNDLLAMATQIDGQVIPTFASAGNRDATITSPLSGSRCWRSDIQAFQVYNGTLLKWQTVGTVGIAKTVLGTNTATVTFSSIPQDFTHLRLVAMVRSTKASLLDTMNMTVNGDSGTHYEYASMTVSNGGTSSFATSSSADSKLIVSDAICAGSAAANVFSRFQMDIPYYTDTVAATKNITATNNAATNPLIIAGGNWIPTSSAAITSLSLTVGSGSFLTASQFTLYGLD